MAFEDGLIKSKDVVQAAKGNSPIVALESTVLTHGLPRPQESVKLTVIHEIGIANSKLIEGVSSGWPNILCSLKSLLETGESLVETRKWPEGM